VNGESYVIKRFILICTLERTLLRRISWMGLVARISEKRDIYVKFWPGNFKGRYYSAGMDDV
jgi:hypothetical protein